MSSSADPWNQPSFDKLMSTSGAPSLPMRPTGATWSAQLKEWVLPYEDVRTSADPETTIRTFIDAIYAHCFDAAGWDKHALTYDLPKSHAPKET